MHTVAWWWAFVTTGAALISKVAPGARETAWTILWRGLDGLGAMQVLSVNLD